MSYLDRHNLSIDNLTPSEILVALTKVNWDLVKNKAKQRFKKGNDLYGKNLFNKTREEIHEEGTLELADWINYFLSENNKESYRKMD